MTWGIYILVFLVVVVGSTVQASIGMGQALVSAPLLRLLEPDLLPGPIVLAGFATSAVVAVRNSNRHDVPEVIPAIAGRFLGAAIAAVMLAQLSERALTIAIGAMVLGFVTLRLAGMKIARSPRSLAVTGTASGISGTIAALGGAPMGLLYEQHAQARDFRGPMGAFGTIGGVISIGVLLVAGEYDANAAWLGLALLPPLMIGWILARWVTPIIDRGYLSPAVLTLASGSATVLILTEVF